MLVAGFRSRTRALAFLVVLLAVLLWVIWAGLTGHGCRPECGWSVPTAPAHPHRRGVQAAVGLGALSTRRSGI